MPSTIKFPPENTAPIHTSNIFAWIFYFLSPYKWLLSGFMSYRIFRQTIFALPPVLIGLLINALENGDFTQNTESYILYFTIFMVFYFVSHIASICVPEISALEKVFRSFTIYSINHLNKLPMSWHEQQGSGKKIQRVMTARRGFQALFSIYAGTLLDYSAIS